MAQARAERIGSIFTRLTSLIQRGAMKKENIPIWYDVYKAFPPKCSPEFGRKLPNNEIRPIFYAEDSIRAKLHTDIPLPVLNLKSHKVSHTQIFLNLYESFLEAGATDEEAYKKALDKYKMIFNQHKFKKTKPARTLQSALLNEPLHTSTETEQTET
ncbi:unnamed protein product [Xylocopa violacea]|uniref:Small ribosomal subunit protein mS23 conserved domain-containing protein n=1 Tax=Xylocopa violacea TaxID=135666 RepID=A0ABP1N6Z6_XYLVO